MDERLQNLSKALRVKDPFLVEREREELIESRDVSLLTIDLNGMDDPLRINVALIKRGIRKRFSMTAKRVTWDPHHFTRSFCQKLASGSEYLGDHPSVENVYLYAEGTNVMTALAIVEGLLCFKDINGLRLDSTIEAIERGCTEDRCLYCDELALKAKRIDFVSERSVMRPSCTFPSIPDPNDIRWHSDLDWISVTGDGERP